MKRKEKTAEEKRAEDLDKWLLVCDDLLESLIMCAGQEWETRRSLAVILINKTYKLIHEGERPTVH